jgi:bacterioferritin
MTGNSKVIKVLNDGARAELQGISQYVIHRAMQENFGFPKLAASLSFAHARDEMRHLDLFIDRILFLEGMPDLSSPLPLHVGTDVMHQLEHDLEGEYTAVAAYVEAALLCEREGDLGSRDLFTTILKEEEGHANDVETQLSIIAKIGLENYLNRQIQE